MLNKNKLPRLIALCVAACSIILSGCDGTNSKDYKKQEEETKQVIRNLTDSDKEYNYYMNKTADANCSQYKVTDKTDEFLSQKEKTFKNINGKNVKSYIFYFPGKQPMDHPNVGYGLLLYKAIKYKLANPKKENEIYTSEFRLSCTAAVNIVKSSKYYGCLKSLPKEEMDRWGFVRISYLLYFAAKIGIKVRISNQLSGYTDNGPEIATATYFNARINDSCAKKVGLSKHTVKEFLTYKRCKWKSYDNKAAADMMHTKFLAVKHYLDDNNKVVDHTIFTSSANLDGINKNGRGACGNGNSQSGVIITNHEYMYLVFRNFQSFIWNYFGPDDCDNFRNAYCNEITAQRAHVATNGYDDIKDTLMFYQGTENDKVFELYVTPFNQSDGNWSDFIPQCRYIEKLTKSTKAILLYMTNPKNSTFGLLDAFYNKAAQAFKKVRNQIEVENSELYIRTMAENLPTQFDDIQEGKHLGRKVIIEGKCHQKDILFEYEEGGKFCSTILFSTLNNHAGAFYNQVNHILVMNENEDIGMDNIRALEKIYQQYELTGKGNEG